MRTPDIMREPVFELVFTLQCYKLDVLVQQGVQDLVEWEKLIEIAGIAQADLYLLATVDVQTEKVGLFGHKFRQDTNTPTPLPHQRLHT